jgi:hypothetical protein
VPFAYTATARNSDNVLKIVNWAYQNQYRVRASGSQHSWSPLLFSMKDNRASCPRTILVDTTKYLTSMILNPHDPGRTELHSISLGTGVKLLELHEFLESNGLGLFSSAAFPLPTVGGMIAVGAHGTGTGPADLDKKSPGHTYGTFSNLIISMTLVAWDDQSSSYILKTLHRSEVDTKAFLTNLGRTFITSVTIRVGKNQMLRSQSHFLIPSSELFAHPDDVTESMRTVSKFIETYGRINPAAVTPGNMFWVLTWHNQAIKPPKSRMTHGPFNYYWMNYFPRFLDPVLHSLLNQNPSFAKTISGIGNPLTVLGTYASRAVDFWGPSKNHLQFVMADFPRMTANPFVLVTSRKNLQLVAHIARKHFVQLSQEYEKLQLYPTPGEFDMRITGVDNPADVEILGAEAPSLSPVSPLPEYPDFDVAIWMETSGYQDTPHMYEFLVQLQNLLFRDLHGKYAIIRAEWSKGWGYAENGAYRNTTVLNHYSRTFSTSDRLEEWNWAVKTLDKYDPHRIFSNDFLDELLSIKI